jgi:endonuclease YncB( thermonuclease family)
MKILNYFFPILTIILCSCSLINQQPLTRNNPPGQLWQVKEGSIYDGDTLRVIRGNEELKIRFCGIDAPEKAQALGIESRDYLRSLVAFSQGKVYITPIESDRYGRTVAELFDTNGNFLNAEMVKAGLAYHYQRYSGNCPHKQDIVVAEKTAQKSKLGVWANKNSQPPWIWRRAASSKQ